MSTRSRAVRGMTVRKFINPFYSDARRLLGVSPASLDHLLTAHATASMTGGNVVTFTASDGCTLELTATYRFFHRGRIGRWVNNFNERSRVLDDVPADRNRRVAGAR
jgi:hypothetical protein